MLFLAKTDQKTKGTRFGIVNRSHGNRVKIDSTNKDRKNFAEKGGTAERERERETKKKEEEKESEIPREDFIGTGGGLKMMREPEEVCRPPLRPSSGTSMEACELRVKKPSIVCL